MIGPCRRLRALAKFGERRKVDSVRMTCCLAVFALSSLSIESRLRQCAGVKVKQVIKPDPQGLTVEVTEIEGQQEWLLTEFQACRDGRCSCPTDEYAKLETLEIDESSASIRLRLKAKAGQAFDQGEIERCLEHTAGKVHPAA